LLIGTAGTSEISITLATTGTPALIAGLLLLVAAMGKSAQVPLQNWLQRAMAGPTPVSALLHSATLVAAGAILLIRVTPMLPDGALFVVGIVGGVTTVVTGLIALTERDLKRLLAASTSSQYGLMLVAIGAGAPVAALLHLIAHAAIKSSLFLGAGVFQHDRESTDLKTLAGAGRARPGIFAGFALAALALAGIPPLAAYFSKDAILAAAFESPAAPWLLPFALAGSVLTGAYMGRALKVLWAGEAGPARASVPLMGLGMGVLVTLAAVLGFGFGALEDLLGVAMEKPNGIVPVMGLAVGFGGLALGWFMSPSRLLGPLSGPAQSGFEIAGGMDRLVLRPVMSFAEFIGAFDKRLLMAQISLVAFLAQRVARFADHADILLVGFSDWVGLQSLRLGRGANSADTNGIDVAIFGFVRGTIATGARARRLQSGFIHHELALTAIGIALIIAVLLATLIFS
jgi:NADH-quinone oxidoreductase subunit L